MSILDKNPSMTVRQCKDCHSFLILNVNNFHKDSMNKRGFKVRCKVCHKAYMQANRIKNKKQTIQITINGVPLDQKNIIWNSDHSITINNINL